MSEISRYYAGCGVLQTPSILLYKEVLTTNHLVGIALCLVGLFFINR